jgi:hypothetical protein
MSGRTVFTLLLAVLPAYCGTIDPIHLVASINVTGYQSQLLTDTESIDAMYTLLVTGGTGMGSVDLGFKLEGETTDWLYGPQYWAKASAAGYEVPNRGNPAFACLANAYACDVPFEYGVPKQIEITASASVGWNQDGDPAPRYPGTISASVDLTNVLIVDQTTGYFGIPGTDVSFTRNVQVVDTMPEPSTFLLVGIATVFGLLLTIRSLLKIYIARLYEKLAKLRHQQLLERLAELERR